MLLVLDGWGIREDSSGNAIKAASTPNYLEMLKRFPNSKLQASGEFVGLPPGLMGNSEVGHLNIGAGRVVIQKLTQISQTIIDGSFFQNPVLTAACDYVAKSGGKLHLIGLLSDGCVHSSPDHVIGLIELAQRKKITNLVVHPILDGRDTPPKSAKRFVRDLDERLKKYQGGKASIGVVCGRYYAMDRDNRWERVEKYYQAITQLVGTKVDSAIEAVDYAYENGQSDEFVLPMIVSPEAIQDGDAVICFNFRPDRVRQISRALTQTDFKEFNRNVVPNIYYACLTEYDSSLNLPVAFTPAQLPSQDMSMTLPEIIACHHMGQLHAAETEKYAHVTYFFNGGKEAPNEGEERELVPSLKVATYDLSPQMQTPRVCDLACQAMTSGKYPFIVLNFANPDMVGHTGEMEAAVSAVESVDTAFGRLLDAAKAAGGTLFITADHGNIEQMLDLHTHEPHTAHTTNPVPFIVADYSGKLKTNNGSHLDNGSLSDVAPTILKFMGIEQPKEMTGKNLLLI